MNKIAALALAAILSGCSAFNKSQLSQLAMANNNARVEKVETTGKANSYTFVVTVSSPDTGCNKYADWWEVISPEGKLLYRRVLLHSHVDEQPFTRTGGTVAIEPQQTVIVRVHMNSDGYSTIAQKGTVESGFNEITLDDDFALQLASVEPLPKNCAF